MGGCPVELITDLGTENGIVAANQCFFPANDDAQRYVPSPRNQRIKGLWPYFFKNYTIWWRNIFSDLEHEKVIDISLELRKECLWYWFQSVIKFDLNKFKEHWNTHALSKSGYSNFAGKPGSLYFLPERYGGKENPLNDVPERRKNYIAKNIVAKQKLNEYQEYFEYILIHPNFAKPSTWQEALSLYSALMKVGDVGFKPYHMIKEWHNKTVKKHVNLLIKVCFNISTFLTKNVGDQIILKPGSQCVP